MNTHSIPLILPNPLISDALREVAHWRNENTALREGRDRLRAEVQELKRQLEQALKRPENPLDKRIVYA